MELTKSPSFNPFQTTDNNLITEDLDTNEVHHKAFFTLFSANKTDKELDNDLRIDETNEFLEGLILHKFENSPEIDHEFYFKESRNPFQSADQVFDLQKFYKEKFQMVDHHHELLNKKDSISQEEISNYNEETNRNIEYSKNKNSVKDRHLNAEVFFVFCFDF